MATHAPRDEQPPILRVKKDALSERVFRYKRDERLAHPSAPAERTEMKGFLKGIFGRRRKRGGLGFVIGSVAILLVAVVVFRIGTRGRDTGEVAGYIVVLRAVPGSGVLNVNVSLKPKKQTVDTVPAMITFLFPDTGESLAINETVPPEGSSLWWEMPYSGTVEKTLQAEVEIGGKKTVLTADLDAGTGGK